MSADATTHGKRALITGASGQDGWYLIRHLRGLGYRVHAQARSSIGDDVDGVTWHHGDLTAGRFLDDLIETAQPDHIYNLAAMSRPIMSWTLPLETAQLNAIVPHRICEIIRLTCPAVRLFQASSSEIFSANTTIQTDETPCDPRTPYGNSKAYAHRIVGAYRAQYGLHLSAGILFNHESPRRLLGFVSQKIAHAAAAISLGITKTRELDEQGRPIVSGGKVKLGNLDVRRDFGFAGDYVAAMHAIVAHDAPGDYVIGTGEPHSIGEFCDRAFACVGLDWRDHVAVDRTLIRRTDADSRANPAKIQALMGGPFPTGFNALVKMMVDARLDALRA